MRVGLRHPILTCNPGTVQTGGRWCYAIQETAVLGYTPHRDAALKLPTVYQKMFYFFAFQLFCISFFYGKKGKHVLLSQFLNQCKNFYGFFF